VLTAFVVESYSLLNPDSAATTASALQQISLQLSNSSAPVFSPARFAPTRSDIRVNVLWFLGLVFSLTAALFGFLIKQWLREYISWVEVAPYQNAVGVRQFRYDSLSRWGLHGICAGLPVLLQISLALFMVGLSDFLLHLPSLVGPLVASAVALCLLVVATTVALPIITAACPFRSPVSHVLRRCVLRGIYTLGPVYNMLSSNLRRRWLIGLPHVSAGSTQSLRWIDLDLRHVHLELSHAQSTQWSQRAVYHVWSISQNEAILSKVTSCLYRDRENQMSVTLADCWPIVTALGGLVGPQGLLDEGVRDKRIRALPLQMRHLLAELLLEALERDLDRAQQWAMTRHTWARTRDVMRFLFNLFDVMLYDSASKIGSSHIASFLVVLNLFLLQGALQGDEFDADLREIRETYHLMALFHWQEYKREGQLPRSVTTCSARLTRAFTSRCAAPGAEHRTYRTRRQTWSALGEAPLAALAAPGHRALRLRRAAVRRRRVGGPRAAHRHSHEARRATRRAGSGHPRPSTRRPCAHEHHPLGARAASPPSLAGAEYPPLPGAARSRAVSQPRRGDDTYRFDGCAEPARGAQAPASRVPRCLDGMPVV
jgi:hypothetical protein